MRRPRRHRPLVPRRVAPHPAGLALTPKDVRDTGGQLLAALAEPVRSRAMPPRNQDRRDHVLDIARQHGSAVDSDRTRHGALSDQLIKGQLTLTCFWSETPWSNGCWDGGILVGPDSSRQVWRIEGEGGVLEILRGT